MPRSPAALLKQLGLTARKGLSQSFLTDQSVCQTMSDAADLHAEDEVLEIGPGLGILTQVLVERAARVVAVELDRQFASHLPALEHPAQTLALLRPHLAQASGA